MLSRVADSLYWLARYIERAENNSRILDVNLQVTLDDDTAGDDGRSICTGSRSWPRSKTRNSSIRSTR